MDISELNPEDNRRSGEAVKVLALRVEVLLVEVQVQLQLEQLLERVAVKQLQEPRSVLAVHCEGEHALKARELEAFLPFFRSVQPRNRHD